MNKVFGVLKEDDGPEGGIEFAKFSYDLSVVSERDRSELGVRSDERTPSSGMRFPPQRREGAV